MKKNFISLALCFSASVQQQPGKIPHTDAGALMSYGPDYSDIYRRTAVYVD